jgi:uncharacterized protein (DUF362 family)
MTVRRRELLIGSAALAAGSAVTVPFFMPHYKEVRRPARSRVAILRVKEYSMKIEDALMLGLQQFRLDVRDKAVVLKPNLVDYLPGNAINTHPILVAAAAECFRRLGAKEIVVAEGPGHQRDTQLVIAESGYASMLRENAIRFIDLNRDELVSVKMRANYSGLKHLWLPRTILEADFVVSMPKIKTHHWSGVTLSMKNMFGIVPGNKYGWPKNILHWHGIRQCILDICATIPIHFVIADGIIAMEGNGPLNGRPRRLRTIVLADDPVAADATCTRLMGLAPDRVAHIKEATKFLGNSSPHLIDQVAEDLRAPERSFSVVPEFEFLRNTT